jgi:hypothetical protein
LTIWNKVKRKIPHKLLKYSKTLLGLTVFQKVMWNITFCSISEVHVEYYVLLCFISSCGILRFTVFQKVMLNIMFYCISEGHVEYYVLLYFRRSCGILRFTLFQKVKWNITFSSEIQLNLIFNITFWNTVKHTIYFKSFRE